MMFISSPCVLLLFILSYIATGFNINSSINHRGVISLHNSINEEDTTTTPLSLQINRRTLLTTSIVSSSVLFRGPTANAIDSSKSTVIVLGANGQTGKECVSSVLASGRKCIATSRSGKFSWCDVDGTDSLQEGVADVTNLDSLLSLAEKSKDTGAMMFCASASTKGGDAFEVDYQGVINAAQCCIQHNIPRLVIVSSGAVTKPNSSVYKLLNLVGKGIMEAKIQGEDGVRALYHDKSVMDKGLGYTIVRPGGLTSDPILLGPSFLEVNQGDDKSGRLSRADVAGICVACLENESTFDSTFECYESNTAKPAENVGLSNILKQTDPTSYKSGREHQGETYNELLGGLKSDFV